MSVSYVARKHTIPPNQLFYLRKLDCPRIILEITHDESGKVAVQADDQMVSASEYDTLKKLVCEMERHLGKNDGN